MRKMFVFAPLALAACNSGPTVTATNASGNEVAAKVEAAGIGGGMPSPGRWEGTMTMQDMQIPGLEKLPPQAAAQMKARMAEGHNFTSCLTPEEAAKPKGGFFGGDKSCRYDHFTMGGGKIDAAMACDERGMKRTMTMTGTYSPDSYAMTMKSAGEAGAMGSMAITMKLAAKRTGVCTGKED